MSELVQCSAKAKSSGAQCKRPAVPGATVCRYHGGAASHVRRAAARRLALGEAMAELSRLGRPIDVEPAEAMLEMVREAAGNVAVYRMLVQSLHPAVDEAPGGLGDDVDALELGRGLAGRVDPANWKAAPHVWVELYDAEREKLVRWSKACRDAGVDERQLELAERTVSLIEAGYRVLINHMVGWAESWAPDGAAELRGELMPVWVREALDASSRER